MTSHGQVLTSAGGASAQVPLLSAPRRARAAHGVFIIDAIAPINGRQARVRVLGRPLGNGELIALAVGRDPVDDVVDRSLIELTLLGTPATLVVALGLWLVTGAALRPVERMRVQAAAATPSRPVTLSVPPGRDEITRLAVTLNDLLAAQQAALRAEQSFLADAGHELRTPLAILAGELEFADRPARTEAELRETITVAREETTRLVRLTEQLLVLARVDGVDADGTGLRHEPTDLHDLAQQAVHAWSATARAHHLQIELSAGGADDGVIAVIDRDRIRQVLDNLLANAVRAAPAGSRIEITVRPQPATPQPATPDPVEPDLPEPDLLELSVRDHGAGFPPQFLPHAFERFRRADPARARSGPTGRGPADAVPFENGSGLGLAVVRRIVEAHGGTATAMNCADGGALVQIVLPARSGAHIGHVNDT